MTTQNINLSSDRKSRDQYIDLMQKPLQFVCQYTITVVIILIEVLVK